MGDLRHIFVPAAGQVDDHELVFGHFGREFDGGVRSLEESTRELVRAIRSAGVFIPG